MTEEIHKIIITGDTAAAQRAFLAARQASQGFRKDMATVATSADGAAAAIRRIGQAGVGLLGVHLGADLVRDVVGLADNWKLVNARIRLAASGTGNYEAAQTALLALSKNTNTEYEALAQLFSRTNKSIIEQNGTQADTLKLVQLVTQASRISGASVEEQSSVVRQLSQALASGVLRGDEFNSVMENAPRIAQALAEGLNVPIGALRNMAEQGQLTTDIVVKALLGQADKIAAEFAQVPITAGAALISLKNAIEAYIGDFDKAHGITQALAQDIQALAQDIQALAGNLPGMIATAQQLLAIGLPVYFIRLAGSVDLATLAVKRFIPAAIVIWSATQVLGLMVAINNERARQQKLAEQRANDQTELAATQHLLDFQVKSLDQYKALGEESRKIYQQDLQNALRAAQLKLLLNAGVNEQEALDAARRSRIYGEALAQIAQADGTRASLMQQYSQDVVAAKQQEFSLLQAVFASEQQALKAAEKAYADAVANRKKVNKEFKQLLTDLNKPATPQQVFGYQVEKAVSDARAAQQAAASAPANEADKLAASALEKARQAGELLKQYKAQQDTAGGIDQAAGDTLTQRLGQDLARIADETAAVQEKAAADQVKIVQKAIQDTFNQAEALKSLQIGFDEFAAAKSFDDLIGLIREKAQNSKISVPIEVVSGSLPKTLDNGNSTGVRDSQGNLIYREGFAAGGAIEGPGTPTSDNILARLSPGEHVLTAREVNALGGQGAVYRLRRMALSGAFPGFAAGGAVGRVSVSPLAGPASAAGDTINLTIPGLGSYSLKADRNTSRTLQGDVRREVLIRGNPA